MTTHIFSRDPNGFALCSLKVAAAFAGIAALVLGYGFFVENTVAIQGAANAISARVAALIGTLGVGFWSAGLLAMGMTGLAALLACVLTKAIGTDMTRMVFMGLTLAMLVASVGSAVGLLLLEHTFTSATALTGFQDAMVLIVRLAMTFTAATAYVALVILFTEY